MDYRWYFSTILWIILVTIMHPKNGIIPNVASWIILNSYVNNVCVRDRPELNSTIKPTVAATYKAGTPILKRIGKTTSPPPIPTIVARIPATIDTIMSFVAILGVIMKSFLSPSNMFSLFFSLKFFFIREVRQMEIAKQVTTIPALIPQ